MTDESSKGLDDEWLEALAGRSSKDTDDARLIRTIIEAQDALTAERISDADVRAARDRLTTRLATTDRGEPAQEDTERTKLVDLSARRPAHRKRPVWQQNPAMLLAASVAFVAVVIMILRNPDIPDAPTLLASYGEIDTLRGDTGENTLAVPDPDTYGRELAARLTEREIPFVLSKESPASVERVISIQIDGVANADGVRQTLDELGMDRPSTSILIVRLIPD